jgi:uncharacterized coiled-coil protein SlyX
MKQTAAWCVAIAVLTACTDAKHSDEYQTLLLEKTNLEAEVREKEEANREIIHFMTQIEDNLAAIREREMGIKNVKHESDLNEQDRVTLIVAEIGTYFDENRNIISKLEKQVAAQGKHNTDLVKLVALQKKALAEKEEQIRKLLLEVEDLNTRLAATVTEKNEEIFEKEEQLVKVRQVLHEKEKASSVAYFRSGSRRDLVDNGIISRAGGVLGIGKSDKVSTRLNPKSFTPVDMRATSEIPLGDIRKQKIITAHPGNSYQVVEASNGASFLKITDPDKFWSISKYLVVVVD